MRQAFFIVLILFLSNISVKGQRYDGGCLIAPKKFWQNIPPEIKDSLDRRWDSIAHQNDSLKILGYSDKRQFYRNHYLRPRHFNDDDMVYYPGPSYDPMPNADVTTPGVHYTLKIKKFGPPFRYYPHPYQSYPPYFRR